MNRTVEDLMFLGQEFISYKDLNIETGDFEISELKEYSKEKGLESIEVLKGVVALRIMNDTGSFPTMDDVVFLTTVIFMEDGLPNTQ